MGPVSIQTGVIFFCLKNKTKTTFERFIFHSFPLPPLEPLILPLKAKKPPAESCLHSLSSIPLLPFCLTHTPIKVTHLVLSGSCSGQGNDDINILNQMAISQSSP